MNNIYYINTVIDEGIVGTEDKTHLSRIVVGKIVNRKDRYLIHTCSSKAQQFVEILIILYICDILSSGESYRVAQATQNANSNNIRFLYMVYLIVLMTFTDPTNIISSVSKDCIFFLHCVYRYVSYLQNGLRCKHLIIKLY